MEKNRGIIRVFNNLCGIKKGSTLLITLPIKHFGPVAIQTNTSTAFIHAKFIKKKKTD